MKKNLFLCISILFTSLTWSQVTVNAPSSVEVGQNNTFSFVFLPSSNIPQVAQGQPPVSSYKITSWFISSANSNMNNTGYSSFNDNSQALNNYLLNQNQSVTFPIKWEDNSNQTTDNINIYTYVEFSNSNGYVGSYIYPLTYTVNINRIFTPTISSPTILSCCTSPVTFSASNYGTANVFNWSVSGGTYTGSGSSITVTPFAGSGDVSASCVVSRSTGLSSYTRSNSVTVSRTARTATFSNPVVQNFLCKGSGLIFQIDNQCGISNVVWNAPNCSISPETIVSGKRQVTITPNNSIPTGSSISIFANLNFTGGCSVITTPKMYSVFDSSAPPIPTGYIEIVDDGSDFCTATRYNLAFVSTNGFNNGQTTLTPNFIFGPGDGIHYSTTTKKIKVCNTNLCTGVTNCITYNLVPPAPCSTSNRLASNNLTTKLVIAPNPTSGNIKVTLPETLSGNYQVFDQTNTTLVQEAKFDNQSELQIDLSQRLKAGIYILKVITENNTFTEKIILNK